MRLKVMMLSAFLTCLLAPARAPGQTGTVAGKVTFPPAGGNQLIAMERYTGAITGKVRRPPERAAAVWLTAPGLTAPPPGSEVQLSQEGYQFEKSLLVVARGTTVVFPNADPDFHNVFSLSRPKRFDLGRYKKGENPAPMVTFDKAGLVLLRCEIHEHMRATVIVVDSPYFAETAADGSFSIPQVPPGDYTLHAQLDKKNRWETPVRITAGNTARVRLPAP